MDPSRCKEHLKAMIGLLQRVTRASVEIAGTPRASIGRGLLVLIGVKPLDDEAHAVRLAERLLSYRVLPMKPAR